MPSNNKPISQLSQVDNILAGDYLEIIRQTGVGQYENFKMFLQTLKGLSEQDLLDILRAQNHLDLGKTVKLNDGDPEGDVSAIQARGIWGKFQFLFDVNSEGSVTERNSIPQYVGESGRVGMEDGFSYHKNVSAPNTNAPVPEINSEWRLYDDGRFQVGNDEESVVIDPINKTIVLMTDGEPVVELDLSTLGAQPEAATVADVTHDTVDEEKYITPKALVDFAAQLGFIWDGVQEKWVMNAEG